MKTSTSPCPLFSIVWLQCLLIFAACLPVVAQAPLSQDFDLLVQKGMQDWKIPGMAVAIVKDGKVFYAKGFGEKKIGGGEKVDEHTLFGIASVSKNITAAALAMLVDEGKITWDTRIVDIIPWFALSDPYVTSEVTVRDALTHRVGIGRIIGNRLQYLSGRSRDELIRHLRYMDLEQPFRTSYVYSNMMYSVAGQVIEYASGKTWDTFLAERIFAPVGMQSNTSVTAFTAQSNAAWPHQEIEGTVVPIPRRNWDNAGPAGGINASVSDVAKWMILQLGEPGVYEGNRLISARQMAEIHRPQVVRPSSNTYGTQTTYGLGWNILDYQGKRVLTHGGATDGFNTAAYLIPELDLGIVVVGNSFNQLGDAIAYTVMDAFMGVSGMDWPKRYLEGHNRSYEAATKLRDEIHAARIRDTKPTLETKAYIGKYASPAYDTIEVRLQQAGEARRQGGTEAGQQHTGKLEIILWNNEDVVADLEHWHHDTFRAVWRNRAQREEFLYFSLGKDGQIEALNFEFALRPLLLQVGAYPSNYTRTVRFDRINSD